MKIIGKVRKCILCDNEFDVNSNRQKYCKDCLKTSRNMHLKESREREKVWNISVRIEKHTAGGINEAVKEANRLGMSYGFYMAKRMRGIL